MWLTGSKTGRLFQSSGAPSPGLQPLPCLPEPGARCAASSQPDRAATRRPTAVSPSSALRSLRHHCLSLFLPLRAHDLSPTPNTNAPAPSSPVRYCRGGAGPVPSSGPWKRRPRCIRCITDSALCQPYGAHRRKHRNPTRSPGFLPAIPTAPTPTSTTILQSPMRAEPSPMPT